MDCSESGALRRQGTRSIHEAEAKHMAWPRDPTYRYNVTACFGKNPSQTDEAHPGAIYIGGHSHGKLKCPWRAAAADSHTSGDHCEVSPAPGFAAVVLQKSPLTTLVQRPSIRARTGPAPHQAPAARHARTSNDHPHHRSTCSHLRDRDAYPAHPPATRWHSDDTRHVSFPAKASMLLTPARTAVESSPQAAPGSLTSKGSA